MQTHRFAWKAIDRPDATQQWSWPWLGEKNQEVLGPLRRWLLLFAQREGCRTAPSANQECELDQQQREDPRTTAQKNQGVPTHGRYYIRGAVLEGDQAQV